jgi:hypothetical protein
MDKIVIEFPPEGMINERYISTFGITLKQLMKKMFGGERVPLLVKGTSRQVKAFAKALVHEKDYYRTYKRYGLNDPKTYRSKFRLKRAISQFEKKTGMKWPLKFRNN